MVDSFMSRFRPCIKQYTDLRVELPSNGVEQPSVRVDLFRIFLFEAEDNLYGHLSYQRTRNQMRWGLEEGDGTYEIVWVSRMRLDELGLRIDRKLSSVLHCQSHWSRRIPTVLTSKI